MCANHPCKSSAPPLKTNRQSTFYQGVSLSDYLKCTPLACLSSSVLKPDTVSVNSVRRAILWFWLIYKMMSDTHVPFLLISNYHVLDFGNRLHRSVWRLSQALQLVHADFPRHASERLFLRIPALGLSMLLHLFTQLTKKNKLRISRLVEASALNLWCCMILSTQCL